MRRIMITGGLGFIGSNLVRYWMRKYPQDYILCVDSMTYAAREKWVIDYLKGCLSHEKPKFDHVYCDIRNQDEVRKVCKMFQPNHVIHLAAESHVCRSIEGPRDFIQTNIVGTFNLIEEFKNLDNGGRFHHVSTDEVFGQLGLEEDRRFDEQTKYAPTSPYAASKASSDHIVRSWTHTYGLDTVITNCSNNFGPNQHDEKLVPKAIQSCLLGKTMTLYGPGTQVRDWLYVYDHCTAIDTVFHKGVSGETYCVGGRTEISNRKMVALIQETAERVLERPVHKEIKYTDDRPTDDVRYAIDCSKLEDLGWSSNPEMFHQKLEQTVAWYSSRLLGLEAKQ